MATAQPIVVRGYRETVRAFARTDKSTRKMMRDTLKPVGEIVREEWSLRFGQDIDPRSAAGLRTRVRQRGVSVEQSLRKTTGLRPDYGRLQQSYGDQALEDKREAVVKEYEDGMERVVDNFSK